MMTAAVAGHGIALCPVDIFQTEIERGDLIILSDIATQTDAHYFVIHRVEGPEEAAIFSDWFQALAAEAGQSPGL